MSDYKEFKVNLDNMRMGGKQERIHAICKLIEDFQKITNEDDDHTHDCLYNALEAMEAIKLYDGNANRIS